jgi:hypothetical protein
MGWGSFIGWIATVSHVVVATNLSMRDLPQGARINESLLGVDEVGRTASLGAYLNHPSILTSRLKHGLSLADIDADGFLHIDIGSRFDSLDHVECVPVVRGGNQHNVEIFIRKHFAIIGVGSWPLA